MDRLKSPDFRSSGVVRGALSPDAAGALLTSLILLESVVRSLATITIADGTFSDSDWIAWVDPHINGTVAAFQDPDRGNPGCCRVSEISFWGDSTVVLHQRLAAYEPDPANPVVSVSLGMDVKLLPGDGQDLVGLALFQGGPGMEFWVTPLTVATGDWVSLSYGSLTPGDWSNYYYGFGGPPPDYLQEMWFGLVVVPNLYMNPPPIDPPYAAGCIVDNWRLTVVTVPEPVIPTLLLLGLAGLLARRHRPVQQR